MYTDAIVSIDVNDADDQNPLFGQSRYWAHLPQPAQKVSLTLSLPLIIHIVIYYSTTTVVVKFCFYTHTHKLFLFYELLVGGQFSLTNKANLTLDFPRERVWKSDRNRCGPLIRTPESMHPFDMHGMLV